MKRDVGEIEAEALRVAQYCGTVLHNRGPAVQGAALAELLSLFISGHAPELREEILTAHIKCVRELVEVNGPRYWKTKGKHENGSGKS